MRKAVFIMMIAALILLAAAVPAIAYHGYGNNIQRNAQCLCLSENGVCIYAEICPNGGACQNNCCLISMNADEKFAGCPYKEINGAAPMKNAGEECGQMTADCPRMGGARHGRNR